MQSQSLEFGKVRRSRAMPSQFAGSRRRLKRPQSSALCSLLCEMMATRRAQAARAGAVCCAAKRRLRPTVTAPRLHGQNHSTGCRRVAEASLHQARGFFAACGCARQASAGAGPDEQRGHPHRPGAQFRGWGQGLLGLFLWPRSGAASAAAGAARLGALAPGVAGTPAPRCGALGGAAQIGFVVYGGYF